MTSVLHYHQRIPRWLIDVWCTGVYIFFFHYLRLKNWSIGCLLYWVSRVPFLSKINFCLLSLKGRYKSHYIGWSTKNRRVNKLLCNRSVGCRLPSKSTVMVSTTHDGGIDDDCARQRDGENKNIFLWIRTYDGKSGEKSREVQKNTEKRQIIKKIRNEVSLIYIHMYIILSNRTKKTLIKILRMKKSLLRVCELSTFRVTKSFLRGRVSDSSGIVFYFFFVGFARSIYCPPAIYI